MRRAFGALLAPVALCVSCASPGLRAPSHASEQEVFWRRLTGLCEKAYTGAVAEAPSGDTTFAGKVLVMHVRNCSPNEIRIPFHVGEDRSRTWVISREAEGLRLKHDHRHADGSQDAVTQYGGDTRGAGTEGRQEFPADALTAKLIPAAATNVWTIEISPGNRFVYALRREGTDRRYRIEFDLSRGAPLPPAPWSHGR